jgi:ATP-binding cassette, subfamily C, bacterial
VTPSASLAKPSTLAFIRFLVASYPRATIVTTVLIALASLAEALGVATLVPTLHTLIGGASPSAISDSAGRRLSEIIGWSGLPVTQTTLVLALAALMAAKGLFQWLALRAGGRAMAQIAADFRMGLVGHLFRARWSFFGRQRIGSLATAVGHETYTTAHAYLALCQMLAAGSVGLVYVVVIALVSWPAVMLAGLVGAMLVAPLHLLLRYVRATANNEARSQKAFVTNLLNAIQSIKPIRAMAREDGFEQIARTDADQMRESIARQVSVTYLMPAVQEPILVLGIAGVLIAGTSVLALDFPTLAIVVFALWRCGVHVTFVNRSYRELVAAEPHFRQLQQLLDASRQAREADSGGLSVPDGPLTIDIDSVVFAHDAERILDKLSLHIPAGAITALVGGSGIGKSTVIDLLLALHRPAEGRILLNGIPLEDISVRAWRRRLGYVPQETTLFHGTVCENVSMGDPDVTEADVRDALIAAGAWVFVEALPHGMHTTVGEQGGQISGGQRQRIAIARALSRRPSLLLLDECTASLDPLTESAVLDTIKALRPRVTVVLATHQPSVVAVADVVYRLEHKRATLTVGP